MQFYTLLKPISNGISFHAIVISPRERYSLAHPNDRAPRYRTQSSPTLPPSRRRKFSHLLRSDRWPIPQPPPLSSKRWLYTPAQVTHYEKKIIPGVRRIYFVYKNNTNNMYLTSIFYLRIYLVILTKISNCA